VSHGWWSCRFRNDDLRTIVKVGLYGECGDELMARGPDVAEPCPLEWLTDFRKVEE